MELITLDPVPSQRFNIPLGGNNYDIKIYSIDGHMSYDLDINSQRVSNNGVWLVSGFKMVNDIPLLVYRSQEVSGNLLLTLPIEEIPDYTRFGISQFLHFLTEDETAEYREAASL